MKVEVCCPDCDGGYLVDAEALEAGLPCPGCGRPLDGGPSDGTDPVTQEVGVDLPAARAAATAEAGAATAPLVTVETVVATAAAPRAASEVVCPRCNLHFKPRANKQARARATTDRPTVLIVEDLVYFREIAAEALENEYEVKAVATKDGARAILDRGGVDLILLDLTLDGGDGGLDLLRELSSKPCPILIYTAQDESEMYGESWDQLRDLGADDIVLKGMNVGDELTRKVGSLLDRESDGHE